MSVPNVTDTRERDERNPKFEWQDALLASGVRLRAKAVGQAIANRWNGDGNLPKVTVSHLIRTTGMSQRSVERALSELREAGWVAQARRGGRRGGETWSSVYRPTYPNPNPPTVTSQPANSDAQPANGGGLVDLPVDLPGRPTPPPPGEHHTRASDSNARAREHCPITFDYGLCAHGCYDGFPCIRWVLQDGHIEYAQELIQTLNGAAE